MQLYSSSMHNSHTQIHNKWLRSSDGWKYLIDLCYSVGILVHIAPTSWYLFLSFFLSSFHLRCSCWRIYCALLDQQHDGNSILKMYSIQSITKPRANQSITIIFHRLIHVSRCSCAHWFNLENEQKKNKNRKPICFASIWMRNLKIFLIRICRVKQFICTHTHTQTVYVRQFMR